MTIIDPGHRFELSQLDQPDNLPTELVFVKRVGPKYPGNTTAHAGTTLQEVLRACISRIDYLDNQKPSYWNDIVRQSLKMAIWALEARAAEQHKRPVPSESGALYGTPCLGCLHVGCAGECKHA